MIVFDIDDTLYLRSEPYIRTYRELFGGKLHLDEEKLLEANHRHKEELFWQMSAGKITMEQMLTGRTVMTFRELGVELSDEEARIFEEKYAENLHSIRIRPLFRDLLDELFRKGVPLGALTNGPSDRQREKLRALDAAKYFPEEAVMASGDVGIVKPDIRIFREFEKKTGLSPDQLWMVGDSWESDISGALEAGWHAVWLNRKKEKIPEEAKKLPDFTASGEEAVCSFLRG